MSIIRARSILLTAKSNAAGRISPRVETMSQLWTGTTSQPGSSALSLDLTSRHFWAILQVGALQFWDRNAPFLSQHNELRRERGGRG